MSVDATSSYLSTALKSDPKDVLAKVVGNLTNKDVILLLDKAKSLLGDEKSLEPTWKVAEKLFEEAKKSSEKQVSLVQICQQLNETLESTTAKTSTAATSILLEKENLTKLQSLKKTILDFCGSILHTLGTPFRYVINKLMHRVEKEESTKKVLEVVASSIEEIKKQDPAAAEKFTEQLTPLLPPGPITSTPEEVLETAASSVEEPKQQGTKPMPKVSVQVEPPLPPRPIVSTTKKALRLANSLKKAMETRASTSESCLINMQKALSILATTGNMNEKIDPYSAETVKDILLNDETEKSFKEIIEKTKPREKNIYDIGQEILNFLGYLSRA